MTRMVLLTVRDVALCAGAFALGMWAVMRLTERIWGGVR